MTSTLAQSTLSTVPGDLAGVHAQASTSLAPVCALEAPHPSCAPSTTTATTTTTTTTATSTTTSTASTSESAPTTHVLVPAPPPFLVLVVDDNALNRRLLLRPLQKAGIACVEAADGIEAVQMFALHSPDLILMDITMPNMNGYQASLEIRTLEAMAAQHAPVAPKAPCRIVATTSLKEQEDLQKGCSAGMDDWLVKPIKPNELVASVKSFQQHLVVQAAIPT
ncbi:hypothetical protein ACQY0O_004655 [Thecaphora frezii]